MRTFARHFFYFDGTPSAAGCKKWERHRALFLNSVVVLALACLAFSHGLAASYSTATISLRGKAQSLAVYDPPAGSPKRPFQIIVSSGDLGWVGLSADISEHFRNLGYRTIGFNTRAYLSSFTGRSEHLDEPDIPGDYQAVVAWARSDQAFPSEVVLIGVSEGAGLTVLGMGQSNPVKGCRGVIGLGMPVKTSLGWHWTDFPMWITKKDPREPQAETRQYLPDLNVPVVMIHSSRDEWDSIDRARDLFALCRGPKRFIAVDAVNHRFSDKIPEVMNHIEVSLQWFQSLTPLSY